MRITLTKANKLPTYKFQYENAGITQGASQFAVLSDSMRETRSGWSVIGWADSAKLTCRPREGCVAVLFEATEDHDDRGDQLWFHLDAALFLTPEDQEALQ
jgi:hypothetical protein